MAVYRGDAGNNLLEGSADNDIIFGANGDDTLIGLAGDDKLRGGKGDDVLDGGADDDNAFFNLRSGGSDRTDLGTGDDLVRISGASGQVRLTFTSAEVGNGNPNDSNTLANQDGGLAVRLQAEDGSDGLTGPVSRFDDEGVTFIAANPGVTFDVRDLVSGAARGDQFEVVKLGTDGNDSLNVGRSDKAHYINAGLGNDRVNGGSDNDFLVGGAGKDALVGNGGNDTFIGGPGRDILRGGAGDDVFIFNAPLDPTTNLDRVRDFGAGDDLFQLDDAVFTGLTLGALDDEAFALLSSEREDDDRIVYDPSTGNLFYVADDPTAFASAQGDGGSGGDGDGGSGGDGDGGSGGGGDGGGGSDDNLVLFANLTNKAILTADDFFVI